jgi:hypothetical protein
VNSFLISKRITPSSPLTTLFGFLMWLSFLLFRVISLTIMVIVGVLDALNNLPATIRHISIPFVAIISLSFLSLYLLSLFWFYKISSGLIKALQSSHRSPKVQPDNEAPTLDPPGINDSAIELNNCPALFIDKAEHSWKQERNSDRNSPDQRNEEFSPQIKEEGNVAGIV